MRRHLSIAWTAVAAIALGSGTLGASEWTFRPSYFSHDPASGERVAQSQPPVTPYRINDPTYLQSGYRHQRSTVRAGGSYDHLHVVETWGAGEFIRPYGEWEYPYREGATPFGPWGNPNGPWTTPFGSWSNPYGLGKLPNPPWPHWPNPYPYPHPPSPPPGPPGPPTPPGP